MGSKALVSMASRHFPFGRSPSAAHRVEQPFGGVDPIQILGHLAAEKTTCDRVRRVALDFGGPPCLVNGYENGARVRAVV